MSQPAHTMGIEWVLLALGAVLTLIVVGFFLFVLMSKDDRKDGEE